MTDLDRDIAELEAALRHLKKLRKADRISKANTGKKRSAAVRQRMSEATQGSVGRKARARPRAEAETRIPEGHAAGAARPVRGRAVRRRAALT